MLQIQGILLLLPVLHFSHRHFHLAEGHNTNRRSVCIYGGLSAAYQDSADHQNYSHNTYSSNRRDVCSQEKEIQWLQTIVCIEALLDLHCVLPHFHGQKCSGRAVQYLVEESRARVLQRQS